MLKRDAPKRRTVRIVPVAALIALSCAAVAAEKPAEPASAGAPLSIVPNAGHLSNLENPEAFNARLVRFLAGLKPRTP